MDNRGKRQAASIFGGMGFYIELIPESRYKAFFAVIAVLIAAYLLRAALQYVVCYWGHIFGVLVEADIRQDLFTHLQSLSFGFYDKNRTGHLMSRMTAELFDITELAHHGPEDLFISGVTLVGSIVIMFTIQWRLALVMLILIPVFVVRRSARQSRRKRPCSGSRGLARTCTSWTRRGTAGRRRRSSARRPYPGRKVPYGA